MAYRASDYWAVAQLFGRGLSDYEIGRRTGVSRGTVRRWRIAESLPITIQRRELEANWSVPDPPAYCYLLGAYLGDGTVCVQKGTWLQIVNDRRYPGVSEEIMGAMEATFPESRARLHPSSSGAADVVCISHPAVRRAFPQHGPGRKHLRLIQLADWQLELTHQHPDALIRGLIHSDGCRVINSFHTERRSRHVAQYSYVRYFFSNHSADIRQIFTEHCALLGVRVTQSNHRNLSISHRHSVAILEEVVGPKA